MPPDSACSVEIRRRTIAATVRASPNGVIATAVNAGWRGVQLVPSRGQAVADEHIGARRAGRSTAPVSTHAPLAGVQVLEQRAGRPATVRRATRRAAKRMTVRGSTSTTSAPASARILVQYATSIPPLPWTTRSPCERGDDPRSGVGCAHGDSLDASWASRRDRAYRRDRRARQDRQRARPRVSSASDCR